MQTIYEKVRREAFGNSSSPSPDLERVRRYGVANLRVAAQGDFPFLLYVQSIPRPAWYGERDFHREKLREVYALLTQEVTKNANGHLRPGFQ